MATRTKSYADRIKAKEAEVLAEIETEKPKPGDREAAEAARLAAHDDLNAATEALEEFHSAWRQTSGDEGPAVEDYTLAQGMLVRATERHEAAKARLDGVKRRESRNYEDETDLTLANLVAEVVRAALPGMAVIPTFLKSHEHPVKAADPFPCAVVSVTTSERGRDGEAIGEVSIDYYRDVDVHSPLSVRHLRDATGDVLGGRGSIYWPNTLKLNRSEALTSRLARDHLRVRVRGYGGAPVVSVLDDRPAITVRLANSLARGLADMGETVHSPRVGDPHFSTQSFRVASHSQNTLSSEVVDGVRSSLVEAVVLVEQTRRSTRNLQAQIDASVRFLLGQTIPGYGLIEKVDRIGGELDQREARGFISSRVPGRSEAKPGFESIAEVRVRCLVTSAVS